MVCPIGDFSWDPDQTTGVGTFLGMPTFTSSVPGNTRGRKSRKPVTWLLSISKSPAPVCLQVFLFQRPEMVAYLFCHWFLAVTTGRPTGRVCLHTGTLNDTLGPSVAIASAVTRGPCAHRVLYCCEHECRAGQYRVSVFVVSTEARERRPVGHGHCNSPASPCRPELTMWHLM